MNSKITQNMKNATKLIKTPVWQIVGGGALIIKKSVAAAPIICHYDMKKPDILAHVFVDVSSYPKVQLSHLPAPFTAHEEQFAAHSE